MHFFSGALLCRITGFLREISMAACFGSSPSTAAFLMSYRNVHQLSRFFGENTLRATFIPRFTQLRKEDPSHGFAFFVHLQKFCLLFTSCFVLLIALCLLISSLFLHTLPQSTEEVLILTLILLPSQIFSALFYLNSALLQCEGRFFYTGSLPVITNLLWIFSTFSLHSLSIVHAMQGLACCLLFAIFLQSLFSYLPARKLIQRESRKEHILFKKEMFPFFRRWIVVAIGIGATNINLILDNFFAREANLSAPAYLNYALRLQQIPFGLFTVAFSSVLLPSLSQLVARKEEKKSLDLFFFSLGKCLHLLIPSTAIIFTAGIILVQTVFERGAFSWIDTLQTTQCLWGYLIGLLPHSVIVLLVPLYYARGEYRTPLRAAFISLFVNAFLNALFVWGFHWEGFSIALATSTSNWISAFFLLTPLKLHLHTAFSSLYSFLGKTLLSSIIACTATIFLQVSLHRELVWIPFFSSFFATSHLSLHFMEKIWMLFRFFLYFCTTLFLTATVIRDQNTLSLFHSASRFLCVSVHTTKNAWTKFFYR